MGRRRRIAFIIDYIETEYAQLLYEGAVSFFDGTDCDLLLFPIGRISFQQYDFDYQYLAVSSLIRGQNIDGIIFVTGAQLIYTEPENIISIIQSFGSIPIISIGHDFQQFPCVMSDCRPGLSAITEHLILRHNRRRFILLGAGGKSFEATSRIQVFKDTLQRHGIAFDEETMRFDANYSYEDAFNQMETYWNTHGTFDFDAAVCLNDEMALGVIDCLKKHHVRIPQDISVTGYDNEMRSHLSIPTLTTVEPDIRKQGRTVSSLLYDMLNGKEIPHRTDILTVPVLRQSCGNCGSNDMQESEELHALGVSEWCVKRSQFIKVIELYSNMQDDMTLAQFRPTVNQGFMSLGIPAAVVVLFETPVKNKETDIFPLPDKAFIFTAFDKDSGYEMELSPSWKYFNPQKGMIPPGILTSMHGMYVISMYRNSSLYGYLMFRPGSFDATVYSMFCKIFSSTLASSYCSTQAESRNQQLQMENAEVTKISNTDELTGLLNRRGFITHSQMLLESAATGREPCKGLILYGDLDGLKKINDTYGHEAGDKAIQAEAEILRATFRPTDIVGRIGGDEFAILIIDISQDMIPRIRQQIDGRCADWNRTSGEPFALSISIGGAAFLTGNGITIEPLLAQADKTLYEEKRRRHRMKQSQSC